MNEIIIHGTPRPIHFGLRAIHEFTRQRGADFATTVSNLFVESISPLTDRLGEMARTDTVLQGPNRPRPTAGRRRP